MNLRFLYYLIFLKLRFLVRKLYYFLIDIIDSVCGMKNKYVLKKGDIFIGFGDFIK